ncbi:MATE efflux family protein [Klebsormidium nitens]|uniref:Protein DETOXIFICATION n=1 Tax=Klebsormidium nitens TaxID=105231 RepID=A0A1Y1HNZ4_KLENI|nr:MATE efflux family protein [Klebsormidium nitens]|eukprot:GAQ78919.1 MATE efflux family protein [Klebsormidium nitens]
MKFRTADNIAQKSKPATPTFDLNPKVDSDAFWDGSDDGDGDREALLTSLETGAGLVMSADPEPDVAAYPAYPPRTEAFAELRRLLRMALPLLGVNALYSSQGIISMAFLGHLGRKELAGGALAISLGNICGDSIVIGMGIGLDPIMGQAFGAKQYHIVGHALQRGWAVLLTLSLPILVLWLNTEWILTSIGQHKDIAHQAGMYIRYLIPGLLVLCLRFPLRLFMKAQGSTFPVFICQLIPFLFFIPLCLLFVFVFRWGAFGIPLAQFVMSLCTLVMMATYICLSGLYKKTWDGFSFKIAFSNWGPFLRLGFPSMLSLCLEWWSFEILMLAAGLLPNPELAVSAMAVCFNISSVCFMVPVSLMNAVATRVSNELGAARPAAARLAAHVAMACAVCASVVFTSGLIGLRNKVPLLFSTDPGFVTLIAGLVPYFAVSQFLDMLQGPLGGVMRGVARPGVTATINMIAYYGVGLPSALLFAFYFRAGLKGMWMGQGAAQAFQTLLVLIFVLRTDWVKETKRARDTVAESSKVVVVKEKGFDVDEEKGLLGQEKK